MMIKVKRIYDQPQRNDGYRILVDRLWPRGVSKDRARVDLWLRDIAPSDGLRRWFSHDPKKWKEFQSRYAKELKRQPEVLKGIKQIEKENGMVTLLYSAKDKEHNNAVALSKMIQRQRG